LGQSPESVFASLVEPFVPKVRRPPDPDPGAVLDAISRMEELVGGTKDGNDMLLNDIIAKAAQGLGRTCSERLTQLVMCLIDQPDYRLAGAEEAIKQLADIIEKTLEHHETLARELGDRAVEAHSHVHMLLGQLRASPGSRRNVPLIADLAEA